MTPLLSVSKSEKASRISSISSSVSPGLSNTFLLTGDFYPPKPLVLGLLIFYYSNSNYYKGISKNLVLSAKNKLTQNKFLVHILDVPGVYEIPVTIKKNIKIVVIIIYI